MSVTGRCTRAAAFLVLAIASWHARADEEFFRVGPDSAGRPEKFFVPEYPPEALAKGITGFVDVEGTVGGLRFLEQPQYHPSAPGAEVFVAAIKEVARFWQFYPAYRQGTCFPGNNHVSLRLIFEIVDGKPKISIEVPSAPLRKSIKPLGCPEPNYPRMALREAVMANVYSAVHIKPDGSVSSVETEAYPRRGVVDELFSNAVKNAFEQCRFPPVEDPGKKRTACYDVIFRMAR